MPIDVRNSSYCTATNDAARNRSYDMEINGTTQGEHQRGVHHPAYLSKFLFHVVNKTTTMP